MQPRRNRGVEWGDAAGAPEGGDSTTHPAAAWSPTKARLGRADWTNSYSPVKHSFNRKAVCLFRFVLARVQG